MKQMQAFSAICLCALLALGLLSCQQGDRTRGPVPPDAPYKNPSVPVADRVEDLLSRMSLDEKIAQLNAGTAPIPEGGLGVGSFGFMTMHLSIPEAVAEYNTLQRQQIEHTRLGIPATRSAEALFAYMGNGSTSFTQPIGLAATFDPQLVADMSAILAQETKSRGARRILAPVVNLTRDPRWGRTNETFGEDPYLSGLMGAAYVRAMEAANMSTMVKHFVANMGLDGQFTGPVDLSERVLREKYFPAFKACVEAGASSMMMAYNTLDGIPCATNSWLINEVVKGEWGFEGFVSTDGGSAQMIFDEQGLYDDSVTFAADLMNAGCDRASPSVFFQAPLKKAMEQGLVSPQRLDDALRRWLREKFENGLFEAPYADAAEAMRLNDAPEHRAKSLEIAKKALVLLKNERETLPFSKSVSKVAVVGPLADWLMVGHYGGYGRPEVTMVEGLRELLPDAEVVMERGIEMSSFAYPSLTRPYLQGTIKGEYFANPDLAGAPVMVRSETSIDYDWKYGSPEGLPHDNFSVRWTGRFQSPVSRKVKMSTTMDDGARLWINGELVIDRWSGGSKRLAEAEVALEQGQVYEFKMEYYDGEFAAAAQLGWDLDLEVNLPRAMEAAQAADVVIAVVGMYENENVDRTDLDLAPEQEQLILELAKLDKPLVIVIQSGTVITTHDWIDQVDAVMVAWYPGCEGGRAMAQALFGDYNPGGKLPITFPKVTGQVPLNYNMNPKGKASIRFIGDMNEPQFAFGHGLSYTQFEYRDLALSADVIGMQDTLRVSFTVTNTGDLAGEEVPQLYLHDRLASVTQPRMKLSGFTRVALAPGESQTISLKLAPDQLKIWDQDMKHRIEPGDMEVMIGAASDDIRLKATFRVE
jgi:beta-glucosidase